MKNAERKKYRAALASIFEKHNPKKLRTLEQILDGWSGRLPALQTEVELRYLKPVYKPQLEALYKKKAPEMLPDVDFILHQYAGSYSVLKSKLNEKYGVELDDAALLQESTPASSSSSANGVEAFFRLCGEVAIMKKNL